MSGAAVSHNSDLLGEAHEGELLREQRVVLHSHSKARATLVEDIHEINQGRGERDGVDREDGEDVELDGKHLVRTDDLDGDFHSEFFVFVFGRRLIVLLHQVLLAVREDSAVRSELKPDVESAFALDVAEGRIEFQVLLETSREEELQFHGLGASVVKNDLLAVELVIDQHVQVVLFLSDIDGNINAFTEDFNRNGFAVVLVVQKQCELLTDLSKLVRDKGECDFHSRVPIDVIRTLELHLSQELLKRIRRVERSLAFGSLYVEVGEDLSRDFLGKVAVLLRCEVISVLSLVIFNIGQSASALTRLLDLSFFNFLVKFFLVDERNSDSAGCLDKDSGRQSALVLEFDSASALLAVDDRAEVDLGLLWVHQIHQRLLACADQGDVDKACFRHQRQHTLNVLVQLRRKGNRDGGGETGRHPA